MGILCCLRPRKGRSADPVPQHSNGAADEAPQIRSPPEGTVDRQSFALSKLLAAEGKDIVDVIDAMRLQHDESPTAALPLDG